jgi:sugar phosphate permease
MKNKALITLFVFNGIFVFASGLLGPLYAVFVETIDTNIISVSLSWSVFLISTTAFMFIVRKYGDLIKEKEYLLMGGYLIRAIVWFLFPSLSTVFGLIILQALLGIGEALGSPAYDAIFAEHLDKNRHVQNYTDWKLISNLVGAVAVIFGGILVNEVGFSTLFYLMGVLAFVSFIGMWIKPRKLL